MGGVLGGHCIFGRLWGFWVWGFWVYLDPTKRLLVWGDFLWLLCVFRLWGSGPKGFRPAGHRRFDLGGDLILASGLRLRAV